MKIDRYDALAGAGLALLASGLWLWWPPAALIVTGLILLSAGVFFASRR